MGYNDVIIITVTSELMIPTMIPFPTIICVPVLIPFIPTWSLHDICTTYKPYTQKDFILQIEKKIIETSGQLMLHMECLREGIIPQPPDQQRQSPFHAKVKVDC